MLTNLELGNTKEKTEENHPKGTSLRKNTEIITNNRAFTQVKGKIKLRRIGYSRPFHLCPCPCHDLSLLDQVSK